MSDTKIDRVTSGDETEAPHVRPTGHISRRRRCGAKTRSGAPCAKWALDGRTRCRQHGGMSTGPRTVRGRIRAAMAPVTHGRSSRLLASPERLREWIEGVEAVCATDPDATCDLTGEIVIARALLGQRVARGGEDAEELAQILAILDRVQRLVAAEAQRRDRDLDRHERQAAREPSQAIPTSYSVLESLTAEQLEAARVALEDERLSALVPILIPLLAGGQVGQGGG